MSRAGARQIHCEAAIPCDKCNNAVLQYECLATLWHISDLRPRCGVVSARSPAVGGGRVAGESGKVPCDSHGDFLCRVCHTCFSALDRTPNPQSEPAVIVRHRIVKPRLDDELAALDCFRCRRPRAWRDANSMIANLTHPLVYAPGANMPQDALDDLRVIDERHDAHLVLKLGCHGCHGCHRDTAADQLPRPS